MTKNKQLDSKATLRIPISWKLLGSTLFVGTVAVAIALSGLQRMNTLNQRLNQIVDVAAERVKLASLLRQYLLTVTRAEKNMIFAKSEEELKGYATTIDEILERIRQHEKNLSRLVSEEDQAQLERFSAMWGQWQANHEQVRRFSGVNSATRARQLSLGDAHEAFEALVANLQSLVTVVEDHLAQSASKAEKEEQLAEEQSVSDSAQRLALISGIRHGVMDMHRAEKNMLLATTTEDMQTYESQLESLAVEVSKDLAKFGETIESMDRKAFDDTQLAWNEYVSLGREIKRLAGEKASKWALELAYDVGGPLADECESLIDSIVRNNSEKMDELKRGSGELFMRLRNTLIGFSTLGIVVSVAVSYFTGRRISTHLSTLAEYAQNIRRARDLSQPVPKVSNDEVGQLAEAFDDMRSTVYRQTRELAKLNQTLKHKNDEMEQFVYTVSHDLKSPLVSCKGLLGLLREDIADGKPDDVEDSIERLGQATDQLSKTIDDLLALSRIGRKPLNLSEIDVSKMLTTLASQLERRIDAVGAELRFSDSLPRLVGDESDVKRAFENLLTNALKYAGENPIIEVVGKQQDKELLYFVRDNGPGIEPEYQKKIFGLFQRLDTSQPGTGLGLASVQKIMRMHGGKVWVESKPEQGATFWLSFPWRKSPNNESQTESRHTESIDKGHS